MTIVTTPALYFTDATGAPLDDGYIYIGTDGLDAQTNQITVYYDAALTTPAVQPIRTSGGYPTYQGAAKALFVNAAACSMTVLDKFQRTNFSELSIDLPSLASDFTALAASGGSALVGFIQSGAGAVARTLQTKVREYPVSPEDFGAVADGVTDDSTPIQEALDTGRPVLFQGDTYYIGTTTLKVKFSNQQIIGNGAEITYAGTGVALDLDPALASSTWKTNVLFKDFAIYCDGVGAIGIRWRYSYSVAENVSVVSRASDQVAWLIDADATNGTGSYYNLFINCHAQGRSFNVGVDNQKGWYLNSYVSMPTRAPNANVWVGGRSSGYDYNYIICGDDNRFYGPTSETVPSGGWHFYVRNYHDTTGAGNDSNKIYDPYIEGQSGANGIYIDQYARNTLIMYPYITSLGAGTAFTDNGTATTWIASDGIRMPNTASTDSRTLDWYQEGTFTPSLTFATPGDLAVTYGASNAGRYTRIGRTVFWEMDLQTATLTFTTASGDLRIGGFPFTSIGAPPGNGVIGFMSGLTLSAGRSFAAVQVEAGTQRATISQSGTGVASTTMAVANATTGTNVRLQMTGSYTVA